MDVNCEQLGRARLKHESRALACRRALLPEAVRDAIDGEGVEALEEECGLQQAVGGGVDDKRLHQIGGDGAQDSWL